MAKVRLLEDIGSHKIGVEIELDSDLSTNLVRSGRAEYVTDVKEEPKTKKEKLK